MNRFHQELLRQAVEAAREGDRAAALGHLQEILDEDDQNAQAWWLFARLTTDKEKKRTALQIVLELEPDHEKAQALLATLDPASAQKDKEVLPGVTRQQLTKVLGGIGGLAVLLIVVVLVIVLSKKSNTASQQRAQERAWVEQTQFAARMTDDVLTREAANAEATQTQLALIPPTIMVTPTLTATQTPTPTLTATPFGVVAQAPPPEITGVISGWSGSDPRAMDIMRQAIYTLTGAGGYVAPAPIGEETGQNGFISPDGAQMIYSNYVQRESNFEVRLMDMEGAIIPSNLDQAPSSGRYFASYMPAFSADGAMVVFIGESYDTDTAAVYLVVLQDTEQTTPVRLTVETDTANYSYPAFSPDGSRIVVVRENPASAENPGPDLVIIDVMSRTISALTMDNTALFETMPRWSPNGDLIVYVASPQRLDDGGRYNLYVIDPNQPGTGILLPDSTGAAIAAIYPVFSPDGQYLAFSSDIGGQYDLYLFNLSSRAIYQLTNTWEEDYPANWILLPEVENTGG